MKTPKTVNRTRFLIWFVPLLLPLVLGATLVLEPGRTARKPNAPEWPTTTKCETQPEPGSTVIGSGEVRPNKYVKVKSELPGRINEIHVEPGEEIAKGHPLLVIEPQSGAQKNVTLYSPLKGIVADVSTRVGEITGGKQPESTLMTLADMSRIYVEVNVDGLDISKVSVGQSAKIIVDAFHESPIRGLVIRKDSQPVAQSDTQEFRVTMEVTMVSAGIRRRLRPGMSATAWIQSTKWKK